ncbi:MAG: hypothetical protein AB7K86_14725 [Rhodospirillales bacterium]
MRAMPILMLLAAAAPAGAGTLAVTADDCARAVRHEPGGGVAYAPGVDAYGRTVAPADLGGAPPLRVNTERLSIPITVDLGRRMGFRPGSAPYAAETFVGMVEYRDGRFWYDGQPLQDEAAAALRERCRTQVP